MSNFADDLRASDADAWRRLLAARARVEDAPTRVVHGPTTREDGTVVLGWAEYSSELLELLAALHDVGAVSPEVPWIDWAPEHFDDTVRRLGSADLDEVVAVLTTLVRSDRFSDGAVATAVDNGSLLAAVDRLIELTATLPQGPEPGTQSGT